MIGVATKQRRQLVHYGAAFPPGLRGGTEVYTATVAQSSSAIGPVAVGQLDFSAFFETVAEWTAS